MPGNSADPFQRLAGGERQHVLALGRHFGFVRPLILGTIRPFVGGLDKSGTAICFCCWRINAALWKAVVPSHAAQCNSDRDWIGCSVLLLRHAQADCAGPVAGVLQRSVVDRVDRMVPPSDLPTSGLSTRAILPVSICCTYWALLLFIDCYPPSVFHFRDCRPRSLPSA